MTATNLLFYQCRTFSVERRRVSGGRSSVEFETREWPANFSRGENVFVRKLKKLVSRGFNQIFCPMKCMIHLHEFLNVIHNEAVKSTRICLLHAFYILF